MTIVRECRYEPPHTHEFPDDWVFAGANGQDPRADVRWRPTTYHYLDDHFNIVWSTQAPLCLDQAIDEFTRWATGTVMYLQVQRHGGEPELTDWQYLVADDLVVRLGE